MIVLKTQHRKPKQNTWGACQVSTTLVPKTNQKAQTKYLGGMSSHTTLVPNTNEKTQINIGGHVKVKAKTNTGGHARSL